MSKKRTKKALTIREGEVVTQERHRQNGGVIREAKAPDYASKIYIKRYRATSECMLDAYLYFNKITPIEHEAAMKFRRAYLRAVLRVRIDDGGSSSHKDVEMPALIVIRSEQILREAYAALSPAQKSIVINVCGDDKKAGDTYRLETLRRALTRLIEIWRLG